MPILWTLILCLIINTHKEVLAGIISLSAYRYFEKHTCTVAYLFDETFVDVRLQQKIADAIEQLSLHTCIEFRWLSDSELEQNQTAYLLFVQNQDSQQCDVRHCGLSVGANRISLGTICGSESYTSLRSILYALGVQYEHLRPDRGEYVNINLHNVKQEMLHLFTDQLDANENLAVTSYDISSLMHFGPQEHAISYQHSTISSRNDVLQASVGSGVRQKNEMLSFRDKKTLSTLLRCSSKCTISQDCLHGGYHDKQCRCVCPYGFGGEFCQQLNHQVRYNVPDCGRVSAAPSGDIASPNYPQRYPKGAFCQWLIEGAKPTDIVVFMINNFDLEHENVLPSDRCLDKLYLWIDGTDVVTKPLSCLPEDASKYTHKWFSSEYNWLLLEFRSDPWGQFEHQGFNVSYKIVDTAPPLQESQEMNSEEEKTINNYSRRLKHIGERRLYCHHCHNASHCVDYDENEMRVYCVEKEACAYKRNEQSVHTWRGCAQPDECIRSRKDSIRYASLDYMDCCTEDFCNIFDSNNVLGNTGTVSKTHLFTLLYFLAQVLFICLP